MYFIWSCCSSYCSLFKVQYQHKCLSLLLYKLLSSVDGDLLDCPDCGLPGVCFGHSCWRCPWFFTNLKNTWLQEVGSWEWHLPVFLVPCFQVVMANLWVIALCMHAWRNSVAKVTFQILFLQGQVFSEKGAADLCTFLPTQTEDGLTRDWTYLNHTDQGRRVVFCSRAERLWL